MANDPPQTNPTGTIDVLAMLRSAQVQKDLKATEIAQAELRGQLKQELIDSDWDTLRKHDALLTKLASLLDTVRDVADEAATVAGELPAPYGTIAKELAHWVDVADDAFKALT